MLLCEWQLRPNGHPFDPYTVYRQFPTIFSLEIHHGGRLSKAPNRLYDGGKVHWFDQIDSDGFSVVEVTHMLKCLGYVNPTMEYWYKMPDKDILLQLSNDKDVLRFRLGLKNVEVDMDDFRKYTDANVEWVGPNVVPAENTQPVEDEVFEDLDLEDFDSGSDPDDVDHNRKKALRMLARKHKPIDGNIYSENFYCGQTFPNKEMIKKMVSKISVVNRRQLWLTKNDKVRVRARTDIDLLSRVGGGGWRRCRSSRMSQESLDLGGDDLAACTKYSNFSFISDRQKGLYLTSARFSLQAEHRYCLKHIYDNMKLSWRGQQYKELLWKSATSPTLQLFERNMEELRSLNKEVYDWLKGIPPHHWARSHFSGRPHCDVLLNNMCEVLNRQLLDARVMDLLHPMQQDFNKLKIRMAAQNTVLWNDLTGIPCKHAVACIWDMTSNGQELGIPESWVITSVPITLTPPDYHTPVGRPPKKRKKSAAELYDGMVKKGKLSRAGKSVTCNKCGQVGHNQRSCKGQRGPTVNESQANASARNSGQGANAID
ncbi:mutator type transposase [Tanacetum coccineum]